MPVPLLKTCESTAKEFIGAASNDTAIPEFFASPRAAVNPEISAYRQAG
jgi:hypothetical protein